MINYIDIAVVAVLLIAVTVGAVRGFIISVVNLLRFTAGILLCFTASNALPPYLYEVFFRQRCYDYIEEKIVTTGNLDGIIQNLNDFTASQPEWLKPLYDVKALDITSKDIAENILNNIFEPVILSVLKVVVFIVVFIIFFALTGLIMHLVAKRRKKREEKRGHKSLARKTDMLLGGAFSLVKALMIIFAVQAVLVFAASQSPQDSAFAQQVSGSYLLNILQGINPFIKMTEVY